MAVTSTIVFILAVLRRVSGTGKIRVWRVYLSCVFSADADYVSFAITLGGVPHLYDAMFNRIGFRKKPTLSHRLDPH